MKIFLIVLLGLTTLSFSIETEKSLFKPVKFIAHTTPGEWSSYLVMNVNYSPVQKIRVALEKIIGKKIKHRNEAHITVITPIEYDKVLKDVVSIKEINSIAQEMFNIQKVDFKVRCLGMGESKIEDKTEQTFYLVVESKNLLNIRQEIYKRYITRKGLSGRFDPLLFYPHITIGFTSNDLHLSAPHYISKGVNSCRTDIKIK